MAPPWVLKPRHEAATIGIRKIYGEDELWAVIHALGNRHSYYLLEQFIEGGVYHVDSIVDDRQVLAAVASGYGRPPFDVAHSGGVFTTQLLERGSTDEQMLLKNNALLLQHLGLVRGVSHTEFIKGTDGQWYFLETSARVGGAHIVDLIEAATGMNMWAEWAKVELSSTARPYEVPPMRSDYAGLVTSLSRQESPDTVSYDAPEVVWRLKKRHHAGLIVRSTSHARVSELLEAYGRRFAEEFMASLPPGSSTQE